MILTEGRRQDAETCFEGEQVTPIQGENYATHAPLASVILRSCSSCNPAFPADRFSDSILASAGHEFNRHKQGQTEHSQGELHQQWYVCEQQRADCSETRELLRATTRSHCAVPRWKLQLQPEPTRHLLPSWWCCQVALNPAMTSRNEEIDATLVGV